MPTYFAVRRVRGPAWDAAVPMRAQALWVEHAAFMDGLAAEGFVVLGGPVGGHGDVLLVVDAPGPDAVRARLAADPWSVAGLLAVGAVEPWTVLLGGRAPAGRAGAAGPRRLTGRRRAARPRGPPAAALVAPRKPAPDLGR